jgi:hypothetical protein
MNPRPNESELRFLNLAYNYFYDLYEEISADRFWEQDAYYRFSKAKDCFLVYSELLDYEPIGWFLEALKKLRPPMEAEIAREYFLFLRNLIVHFPVFNVWDEVFFDKELINWSRPGQSIDRFLATYAGHQQVKYRVWNPKKKTMTYVSINFPAKYENDKMFLKDLMPEKEGLIFSLSLMRQVLDSQVESVRESE